MAEITQKGKTIAVDHDTHELISRLSKENDLDHGKMVKAMGKYFSKYGIDPNMEPANLAKEIKKLEKTVISFIRAHESMHLIPIANQVELLKKDNQNIKQLLEKSKTEVQKSSDKVELSAQNYKYYRQIMNNMCKLEIKAKIIENREGIKIDEIAEASEKLLKMN